MSNNTYNSTSDLQEASVTSFALIYHIYRSSRDLWFFTLYGIEGTIGIILNILIITVFMQKELRKSAHNVYLVNLSIAELIVSIGTIVRVLDAFREVMWSYGGCLTFYIVFLMASFVQVQSHVLIAVERFIALKWPTYFKTFTSKRLIPWQMVILWCLSALECIYLAHGVQRDFLVTGRCVAPFGSSVSPGKRLYIALVYLLLPCTTTACLYGYVLRKLWARRRVNPETGPHLPENNGDSRPVIMRRRTRGTLIFFIAFVLYVLCYFPISLTTLIQAKMQSPDRIMRMITMSRLAYLLLYAPIFINPMVHILANKDFRVECKKLNCSSNNHIMPLALELN